ncbi:MAG: RNA polymerase sigma-70 factor [Bacteroidota bacterium]
MKKGESTCEQETFRKLFELHAEPVRNFVYYRSGDSGFAEDCVQEAFIRLWKKCASVPVENAKGFLFTVAKNLILDLVKHEKVKLKFQATKTKNATAEDPEFLLQEKEFKEKLEACINALPENQRTVFLMNRIDKLKYREIAEMLGISQKAVEKRMHKALKFIREQIGNI